MNLNALESNFIPKFNYRDLIIFIVPILLFSLYLFVYSPGVLTVASYSQLHQIATDQFTNAHPIFHTLLEMIFLKIFKSPFYIGLAQILIFSVLWMAICKYHRNDLANSSDEFVLQFIVTLIICLIPINAVYSITLSSNVLFSYSLMLLCFLIKVMIDKNGEIDTKLIVIMALTMAVMSGLSNYGLYVALFSLIVIITYLYKNDSHKNTYIRLAGIAIVCILLVGSLNFICHVENDNLNIQTNDAFEDGINLNDAKTQFFQSINGEPSSELENATSANIRNSNYKLIDSFVNMFRGNFLLDGLFNNPILYMILSVLLLALIYNITKSWETFLIYAPAIFNMAFVVITGQNNLYSNLLIFYLIAIIFISLIFKLDFRLSDTSNLTQMISKPKAIAGNKTPQTRKMEDNYKTESYYSDLETEIENLSLEDINEMLGNSPREEKPTPTQTPQGDSDLVNEILKEIEREKK